MLDQKRFEDAIEKFDRAIEIEKSKAPPINVLAMVNKGLTLFQWKNDLAAAEKIIKEALVSDPECEAAVATLAQISLQRGEVEQAMTYFQRQVELARTEADIMNALQFMHVRLALSISKQERNCLYCYLTTRRRKHRTSLREITQTSQKRTGMPKSNSALRWPRLVVPPRSCEHARPPGR